MSEAIFSMRFSEVQDCAAQLRQMDTKVEETIQTLETQADQKSQYWAGSARAAYDDLKTSVAQAQANMKAVLSEIHVCLTNSGETYSEAENTVRSLF